MLREVPSSGCRSPRIFRAGVSAVCLFASCFISAVFAEVPKDWPRPEAGVSVSDARIYFMESATLASSRLGWIKKLNVREGSHVKEGEELIVLDDRVAEAQLATAQKTADNDIEILFANKAAEVAEVEYQMNLQANLRVPNSVPEIEIQRLKLTLQKSLFQIKQAIQQQEIDKLKRDEALRLRETFRVNAEFDGIVSKVYKHRGEAVREGESVIDLVNPDRIKVQGHVHYADVHRIKKGDPVKVHIRIDEFDIPQEQEIFDGELVFIDPSVEYAEQQNVRVWAEVKNRNNILVQGFLANMIILTDEKPAVPKGGVPPKTARNDIDEIPVFE